MRKEFFAIVLVLCFITALVLLTFFSSESPLNIDTQVDHEVSVQRLFTMLHKKEKDTSVNIDASQVIEVWGFVKEVNYKNNRATVILKTKEDTSAYIICDLQKKYGQLAKGLKENDSIKIKGIFKGVLKDAIFLDCIISYAPNNE